MFLECYHKIYKDLSVQGFLDYNSCAELENIIQYNVSEVLESNNIIYNGEIEYMCIYAHGSRVFGNPKNNSDIDFVLFYKGSIREDDLFNIFVDENIYIEHVKCDFNPIQIDDDSDIEYYIRKHDIEYHLNAILEKKINLAFALSDLEDGEELSSVSKLKISLIEDKSHTRELLDLKTNTVDLGLPSGTLWCKYNLGCDFNLLNYDYENTIPEDWYGEYFAWGELVEKSDDYTFRTYKFVNNRNIIKYTDKDNLTLLLLEDDAAYLNLHIRNWKFKIPTKDLFYELLKYTSDEIAKNYKDIKGLNGREFTSKINGNKMFIPSAGCYNNSAVANKDWGYVWSNSLSSTDNVSAYSLNWGYASPYVYDLSNRWVGLSIRPVINL